MTRLDSYYFGYIEQYEESIKKYNEELAEVNSYLIEDYYSSHAVYYPLVEKGYSIDYLLDLPKAEFTLLQLKIIDIEEQRNEAMKKSMQI